MLKCVRTDRSSRSVLNMSSKVDNTEMEKLSGRAMGYWLCNLSMKHELILHVPSMKYLCLMEYPSLTLENQKCAKHGFIKRCEAW